MKKADIKPGQLLKIIETNRTPSSWIGEEVTVLTAPFLSSQTVSRGRGYDVRVLRTMNGLPEVDQLSLYILGEVDDEKG